MSEKIKEVIAVNAAYWVAVLNESGHLANTIIVCLIMRTDKKNQETNYIAYQDQQVYRVSTVLLLCLHVINFHNGIALILGVW